MKRNLAIDGLRGLLLILIAINHIESPLLIPFTRSTLGFVSAAEGFIFLSGFVAACVYGRYAHSAADLYKKVYKRILTIYIYAAIGASSVFLLLTLNALPDTWYHSLGNYFLLNNYLKYPLESLAMTLLQVQQMGYFDILVIYMFSMLFLPKALLMLSQGKAYLVIAISILVWLSAQFITDSFLVNFYVSNFPDMQKNSGYIDILAWQILFYAGVVCAFFYQKKPELFVSNRLTIMAAILAIGFFIMNLTGTFIPVPKSLNTLIYSWRDVGLVRLINTFSLAIVIAYFIRHQTRLLALKPLVLLGQHSLQVFTFHAVTIYYFWPWMLKANESYSAFMDLALTFGFVLSLFIPALAHKHWRAKRVKFNLS